MIDAGVMHGLVDTLGWTLLHFLWQGLVLWGVFAMLMLVLQPASATVRYWVGMGTLAAMGAAPVLTFVALSDGAAATLASVQATTGSTLSSDVGDWGVVTGRVEQLLPWTVAAWLLGVVLLSGRLAIECLQIRRLALSGIEPLTPRWQRVADELRTSLGVRQTVRIMTSVRVAVPMVIGWFRPLILIPPSALLGLTPRQLELIISHELAHVKRLDYLFNWLQIVVETLLFYHPGVRAVSARIREEREHCCDDVVVHHSGDRLAYARALTEVAGLRCSAGMQVAVAATGGRLLGRVRRLVVMPGPQRGSAYWMTGLVFVAVLAAGSMRHLPELGDAVSMELPVVATAPSPPAEAAPEVRAPAVVAAAATPTDALPDPLPIVETVTPPVPTADTPVSPVAPVDEPAVDAAVSGPAVERAEPVARVETPAAAPVIAPVRTGPPHAGKPEPAPSSPVRASATVAPSAAAAPEEARVPAAQADEAPLAPPAQVKEAPTTPVTAPAPRGTPPATPVPVVTGGALLKSVQPDYPRRARLKGIGGSVRVRYVVNEKGRVTDIKVLSSRQGRYFERPVRKALKRWRYEPFAVDGVAIAQTVERSFDFGMVEPEPLRLAGAEPCQKVTGTRICRSLREYEELPLTVVGETP